MGTPILEMKNITKTFPGVKALSNVSFSVAPQEIHCLVGENGAGKSTLMKVLSGVHPHGEYTGDIVFDGKTQVFHGIADSERVGIAIIYQELALVPDMTVYDNIFLGHEISRGITVDLNETIKKAAEMLGKVRLSVSPETPVKDLGVGKQQLVEIAKALSRNVKLLVLDEPTAALNEDDCENLFSILRELKGHGVTCVLISHKLKEVIRIADTVTVLRDGQTICTLDAHKGEVSEAVLIRNMVGRDIDNVYPPRSHTIGTEEVLRVQGWSAYSLKAGRSVLRDVSFNVRRGEIVGFAGLMGSGRTELARSIFGNPDGYRVEGAMFVHGAPVHYHHPHDAIEDGVA
ncbi:MAG TPA: ATP-binding cassette domain-containing protein, partial [Spirochaetia bacterium]|nr:ATP-binding cassette domain-containing protein [Spirochaetia bacterium]